MLALPEESELCYVVNVKVKGVGRIIISSILAMQKSMSFTKASVIVNNQPILSTMFRCVRGMHQ